MAVEYPVVGFYFKVSVGGEKISFQEVTGLEVEMELEEISEGGNNNYKHRLPKGTKYNNLVLKKAYFKGKSPMLDWCNKTVVDENNFDTAIETKDILVELLDEKGESIYKWNVKNAYPIKLQMSNLKSDDNALAVESIELAYRNFTVEL